MKNRQKNLIIQDKLLGVFRKYDSTYRIFLNGEHTYLLKDNLFVSSIRFKLKF